MQFKSLDQQNGDEQGDDFKRNFLCVSDLNGDFLGLEKLISEFEPRAIIHTGNFGFLDDFSISNYSHNHLIDIIETNSLLTKERKESLLSLPEELLREELTASELSGFQTYLNLEAKFSVPIYTTHGFFDDVVILNKLLDNPIHNLHLVYTGHSQVLDYGNIPIRLFGLGGNLIRNKLFDHGTISSVLAGSREGSWITLVQLGALYQDAQATETPGEIRILLTVTSPISDTVVSQLASCIKADFTFSSNTKTRYHSTFSIGNVYPVLSVYRDQMVQSRLQFNKIYGIVQNHYEKQLSQMQKQLVKLALRLLDCLPPEETSGLLSEQGYFTDCQHLVLSRFQFGYAFLVATQTQIALKLQSEGVNFNHREKSFDQDNDVKDCKDKLFEETSRKPPKNCQEKTSTNIEINSEKSFQKSFQKTSKKNAKNHQNPSSDNHPIKNGNSSVEYSNGSQFQDSSRYPETPETNSQLDEERNEERHSQTKSQSFNNENFNPSFAEPDCSNNEDIASTNTLEQSQPEKQSENFLESNSFQDVQPFYPSQYKKENPANIPEHEIHFETKTANPEFEKDQDTKFEVGSPEFTSKNIPDSFNSNNGSQLRPTSENSMRSVDRDFGMSRIQQREASQNKNYSEYTNHRGVQIVILTKMDPKPDIWRQVSDRLVYVQLKCEFKPDEDFDLVFEGLEDEVARVFVFPNSVTYINVEVKDINQRDFIINKLRGRRFHDFTIHANDRSQNRNQSFRNGNYRSQSRDGGGFRDSSRKAAFANRNSQPNHSDSYPKRDFYQGN